jgi:hypothetical protein
MKFCNGEPCHETLFGMLKNLKVFTYSKNI